MNKRLLRGGSWLNGPWWVRSASHDRDWPTARSSFVGFRLAGPKTELKSRTLRGGSWNYRPRWVCSVSRGRNRPTVRISNVGFRLAGPKTEKKEFALLNKQGD